ncbi:MAG: transposase [Bacteroidales bacterium]
MKAKISEIPHRKSLRLNGYDYSGEGLYFITICTRDHRQYFGRIINGVMIPNETGCMAEAFLHEISLHFCLAIVARYVVMPNHVHLILVLNYTGNFADDDGIIFSGIGLGVGPCHGMALQATGDGLVGTRHGVSPPHGVSQSQNKVPSHGNIPPTNHFGKPIPGSVSVIINQYKATVKRWCNQHGKEHFQWQPRFYDHIIRNEESFQNIVTYISNNPKLWEEDRFYLKCVK